MGKGTFPFGGPWEQLSRLKQRVRSRRFEGTRGTHGGKVVSGDNSPTPEFASSPVLPSTASQQRSPEEAFLLALLGSVVGNLRAKRWEIKRNICAHSYRRGHCFGIETSCYNKSAQRNRWKKIISGSRLQFCQPREKEIGAAS